MSVFMSEEWFEEIADLTKCNDGFEVPESIKGLTINLNVRFGNDVKQAHFSEGKFGRGLMRDAPVTVNLPSQIAKKIFVERDSQAGMQAFMSGDMHVDGDVSKLMVLQTARPTPKMRKYLEDVQHVTD